MYKILVIDDEEKIRNIIVKYSKFEGYSTIEATNGLEAIEICNKHNFDIIIMDIMMPELDGFSAVKKIRKLTDTPVIMLSARGEEYDKIHGFELGIDDYVVKPFSPKELMMRIEAIMKRNKKNIDINRDVFIKDKLTIDFTARKVLINNIEIVLTPREYELIFHMVKNKNIALTREHLMCEVWGYDFDGYDRTLDTHIKSLRKKLGDYSQYIITIRGVGYRFEA